MPTAIPETCPHLGWTINRHDVPLRCANCDVDLPPDWNMTKAFERADSFRPIPDPVNHPSHYTAHPSGIECITITEHMNFCLGNAIKYVWRAGLKNDDAVEDLKKARWYLDREIARRERAVP